MIRSRITFAALFVAGASAWFLMSTILLDEVHAATIALAASIAYLALAALSGLPSVQKISAASWTDRLLAAASGILTVFAAPALVMTHRYTDAPPGAETLFFITAVWAVIVTAVTWIARRGRPELTRWTLVLVGVLGSAALLANWERPSSFSPMVRYPNLEIGFVAAGLCFAVGVELYRRSSASLGRRETHFLAAVAAVLVALVYALAVAGVALVPAASVLPTLLACGVGFAVMALSWTELQALGADCGAAGIWFLPPLVITVIGVAEQAIFPRGPDPVVWMGVAGALVLVALVNLAVPFATSGAVPASGQTSEPAHAGARRILIALAVMSLALSLATLAAPILRAVATGELDVGTTYRQVWFYLGYEGAGGWLAPLASLLLLGAVLAWGTPRRLRVPLIAACAALVTAATYPLLVSTPLHTWNRWVPVEVQSEYGTEYASLTFSVVHNPLRLAALALAVVLTVALVVLMLVRRAQTSAD